MNRREFLECATLLATGLTASKLGWALTAEQQTFLAAGPDFIDGEVDYFTPAQRQVVAALAETIIPRTDTPGAIDAGVPRYIELMVSRWMNAAERAIFDAGLAQLEADTVAVHGQSFAGLDMDARLRILERLEDEASDSSWYDLGNTRRDFVSDAPFICQAKELTVWGFFTSEVGGTEVLRFEPMPMRFDGEFPLAPTDSSWSGRGF